MQPSKLNGKLFVWTAPLVLTLGTALPSCGANVYKSQEAKDPATQASLALEKQDPGTAINILTSALGSHPGNLQYLSILSLAYAERAGCDPLSFAANLAAKQDGGSSLTDTGATSGLTDLFSLLPAADDQHLADIDQAVTILNTEIPADSRQTYDTFKLALFETAAMVMHLKSLDTAGVGSLSPSDLENLTPDEASSLINEFGSAQALIAAVDPNDANAAQASQVLAQYQAQIDASPGATPADKLKSYLATSGVATGTATSTDTGT